MSESKLSKVIKTKLSSNGKFKKKNQKNKQSKPQQIQCMYPTWHCLYTISIHQFMEFANYIQPHSMLTPTKKSSTPLLKLIKMTDLQLPRNKY